MRLDDAFAGQKIVARRLDGSLVKGYTYDFGPRSPAFHVFAQRDTSVDPVRLIVKDLKAVFSVRDFAGNPAYRKRRQFPGGSLAHGRKVEVTFTDGEVLLGFTEDYSPAAPGFLVVPSDPFGNNLKVFVVSTAVRGVRLVPQGPPLRHAPPSSRRGPLRLPRQIVAWLRRPEGTPPGKSASIGRMRLLPASASGAPASAAGRRMPALRLMDRLAQANLLTADQLQTIAAEQRRTDERLPTVLRRLGFLDTPAILDVLGHEYGLPTVDVGRVSVPEDVLGLVKKEIAAKHGVFPVRKVGNTLTLAIPDPTAMLAVDDVRFATGLHVTPVLAPESAIREAIRKYYVNGIAQLKDILQAEHEAELDVLTLIHREAEKPDVNALGEEAGDPPIIRLVNLILADGIRKRASDIHLEPDEGVFRVRYRIDGVLHEAMIPPKRIESAVLSRLKIMANMDITERRVPQDGRIAIKFSDQEVDLRVSSLPTVAGEKIVLRILERADMIVDLAGLGFEPDNLARFRAAIQTPAGMILVTGPTGSGKSTTLYSAVSTLNSMNVNIVAVEDPVECRIPRVNQVNVREDVGLTFTSALRGFLRQDPDIILVGEMRDTETARIAIRAALTGHLVLSTLHTNDAPSTVARLRDMGIPPFMIASSLRMVVSQRLCRRICRGCRETVQMPIHALLDAGFRADEIESVSVYRGTGCTTCMGTGYQGRIAVHEVLPVTPEFQDAIGRETATPVLRDIAIKQGMQTLREDGLRKVAQGLTTLEELSRVAGPE